MAKDVVRLKTPPFVAAFTQGVFEAQPGPDGGKAKYGLTAIWDKSKFTPKDHELWKALLAELDSVSKSMFKTPFSGLADIGAKTGLRKGESKPDLEGFGPGKIFASLTSQYAPDVVDFDRNEISKAQGNSELVYSGCLMRASVNVYGYNKKGKGVAIGLFSLQVISSDESKWPRIDNRTSGADDFADDEIDASWADQAEESVDGDDAF